MLWLVIPAAILLITNTLSWPRYYIMLIAPWSVLAGFAVVPLASADVIGWIRGIIARLKLDSNPAK